MNMLPRRNGIVGLSSTRRLPRLGKIKLGIKVKSSRGTEYPKDVDYFVCPPEVQLKYGERPVELEIMFPVDNEDQVFPQALKVYSKTGGLLCRGDGEQAERRRMHVVLTTATGAVLDDARPRLIDGASPEGDPNEWVPVSCIGCPLRIKQGDRPAPCSAKANLMVMLYNVNVGGVYQIDTGSVNNIINLNSSFDYVRGLVGRIAMVPFKLRRVARQIQYEGKVVTKALLQLDPDMNLMELVALRRDTTAILARSAGLTLPAPVLEMLPPTDGIVDVEPEEEPEEDAPLTDAEIASVDPPVNAAQVRELAILATKKLGGISREERLVMYGTVLGHGVHTSKDLTQREWRRLVDALNKMSDKAGTPKKDAAPEVQAGANREGAGEHPQDGEEAPAGDDLPFPEANMLGGVNPVAGRLLGDRIKAAATKLARLDRHGKITFDDRGAKFLGINPGTYDPFELVSLGVGDEVVRKLERAVETQDAKREKAQAVGQ